MSRVVRSGVLAFLLLGCAQQTRQVPPVRTIADVHELMEGMVAPLAQIVFESVWTAISLNGIEEHQPQNDEEWEEVEHAALALAESGNLLMFEGRAVDQGDWIKYSNDLIEKSLLAAKSAEGKDKDALFSAGADIYEVCQGCHMQYVKEE